MPCVFLTYLAYSLRQIWLVLINKHKLYVKFKIICIMKNKLHNINGSFLIAWIMALAIMFPANAQSDRTTELRFDAQSASNSSGTLNPGTPTTFSFPNAIVDREPDNETGLISTKGNNNTGVYGADYFELTASVDLGDLRFYGFPSESSAFSPTVTGFNVIIYENDGTTPDGDPETPATGVLELRDIALADFDLMGGIFTINVTQANGGQTVTLPAGEYWVAAYPSVSTPPTDDGRWNWLGSLSASPTYESVLIDPADLFQAGATSWTPISTLISPDPFPSFAWTMTEDGDSLPPVPCQASFTSVEPITKVVFADIDNSSSASSNDEIEDFTHIEGEVEQGGSYVIELEGFTDGPYDNYFTVWIDWNQDDVWESTNDEMYEVGFITNSTGVDGIKATATIDVPQNAVLGSTSMRIIKNYSTSPTDPCGSYGWGQAEDYTIVVIEPLPCEAVTNVDVTNIGGTAATVSWTAVAAASDGYIVDVYEEGADPSVDTPVFNDTVATGTTTVQVTGLTPETEYDVYVTSDCVNGEATSDVVTFTTELLVCDAVTNVDVTNIAETTATVTWNASATATDGYIVDVYENGADPSTDTPAFTDIVAMGVTTSSVTGLTPDTDYDVYVTSDCGNGDTATSVLVSFTTEAVECDVVTDVEVSDIKVDEATISWTPSVTATDGYIVEVYVAGSDPSTDTPVFSDAVASSATTVLAIGLSAETEYDVYVISDCGFGETATSDVVSFETKPTTNVADFDISNLTIYPNPTNSNLNISASKVIEDIQVYNILGQQVLSANPNSLETTLDVRGLNAGNYILKVTAEGITNAVRFIKK